MAKIENVDYNAIPGQAESMEAFGLELNGLLASVYSKIGDMHANWYGQRYNMLVKEFNEMLPQINSLLTLVVSEIPFTLKTIANNYSQADTGSTIANAARADITTISDISVSNDVGMRFISSEVETVRQAVSNDFESSKEKMETIQGVFDNVSWNSEAAEAFRSKFASIKSNIVSSFENINVSFVNLMKQTEEDIQAAERANTVQ